LFESQNNQSLITSNIKLNFARKFGAHDINAFVGYEQSKSHLDYFDAGVLTIYHHNCPSFRRAAARQQIT
jgi:hypothetical protein